MNSYKVVGSGPRKVLCLHGWFGSSAGWGPLVDVLDTKTFTYVFMDYRGYGAAKTLSGSHSMEEIATDALAVADQLGWQKFSLIGHSMGGMAIQRVLLEAPQRIEKLVALTPVPANGYPFDEEGWAFFSSAAESAEVRRQIINHLTGNRLTGIWLDQMVSHSMANSTHEAFAEYLKAWGQSDFSARIKGNSVPIKVILGSNDPALNEALITPTYLAWYPNVELDILENAGHFPMYETPVALATSIENFLRG